MTGRMRYRSVFKQGIVDLKQQSILVTNINRDGIL